MIKIVTNAYNTYTATEPRWWMAYGIRLAFTLMVSFFLSIFARESLKDVYSVMATCLTVLTGFTFTAYFSNSSLAGADLPKATSEDDRVRLQRLGALAINFEARSKYFIPLAILSIAILGLGVVKLKWPQALQDASFIEALQSWSEHRISWTVDAFTLFFTGIVPAVIIFMFLECLYTFYRMAETIIAIVERRREYLQR